MTNKFLSTIITIFALAMLATFPAQAQLGFATQAEDFFIQLVPTDTPGPEQDVAARLLGFGIDTNASDITWIHNGRIQAQGRGVKEYRFRTGGLGSRETLQVSAIAPSGVRKEASLSFVVTDVSLLWQADTSVPFWYKGKALASPKSSVTVSALPELFLGARKLAAETLIYRWTLDDDFKQNRSGAGRDTFRFDADFSSGVAHTVKLEVTNAGESVGAGKSVEIVTVPPSVLVYEENPLSGAEKEFAFYSRRGDLIFAGEERTYIAEPFFFSLESGRANLSYAWQINGREAEFGEPANVLNLTTTSDARGRSTIEILVRNAANILQEARQSFFIDVF